MNIATFIESMEGGEILENSILLGGFSAEYGKEFKTSNGGDCTNRGKEACEYSYNGRNCKNQVDMCTHSTNRGSRCNNNLPPLS